MKNLINKLQSNGNDGLILPKTLQKPKAKKLKPKIKVSDNDLIERDNTRLATEDGRELLI